MHPCGATAQTMRPRHFVEARVHYKCCSWAKQGKVMSTYTCDNVIGDAGVVGHNCEGAQSLQALNNTLISSASICWGFVDSSRPRALV